MLPAVEENNVILGFGVMRLSFHALWDLSGVFPALAVQSCRSGQRYRGLTRFTSLHIFHMIVQLIIYEFIYSLSFLYRHTVYKLKSNK